MTIFQLINKIPVTAEVHIKVMSCYGDHVIWEGKYEDTTPEVFNLKVWDSDINEVITKDYNQGKHYITDMTLYTDDQRKEFEL